jgi:glycosyltransferase involved in cell wall biosynthesis
LGAAIEELVPIAFDEQTKAITVTGALTPDQAANVLREVARVGFSAFRTAFHQPYTHRVEVNAAGGVLRRHYLARLSPVLQGVASVEAPVQMQGFLPWERREDAYGGATVVVVPSRNEPFGMVVLEAMQHRVAVVYPGRAGVAEAVSTGVRVDPADIQETARQVVRLLSSRDRWWKTVGDQARDYEFHIARAPEQGLERIWREVVENRSRGGSVRPA